MPRLPVPTFTLPTIHPNGTSAKSLSDEYYKFKKAIDNAVHSLQAATCNARDFYPQSDVAWRKAQDEREEAFRKLKQLQIYASAWYLHVRNNGVES